MSGFCSQCGKSVDLNNTFCMHCGFSLKQHPKPVIEEIKSRAVVDSPEQRNDYPKNSLSKKPDRKELSKKEIRKNRSRALSNSTKWRVFRAIYWATVAFISLATIINFIANDSEGESAFGILMISVLMVAFLQILFVPLYLLIRAITKRTTVGSQTITNQAVNHLKKNTESEDSQDKPFYKKSLSSVGSFLVVIAIFGGLKLFNHIIFTDKGNGSASEQAQSLLTSTEIKEYVSAEHNFRINFPGFPVVESDTIDLEGYKIPYTLYSKDLNDGESIYSAYVWDYVALPGDGSDLSLEGGLNGMIQNMDGAKLVSSSNSSISGLPALEGVFTVPIEGKNYDGFTRITIKGKKAYATMTMGVSKPNYESFVNSLVIN